MSVESFNRLVKLAARAFYDDITLKGENQPKNGRSDNRGMAVVVLDALTRRPWVREEDLAKHLKLHSKQLRRTLRYFEEEKLVTRDHRRETAKGAKVYTAAVAATAEGAVGKDGEEKAKMHTHSYCCLDYAQIYDVVRYRMHKMKKKLKDELENRNTVQEYICPTCKRKYSALDAAQLISPNGEYFSCEKCNTELVAESDKLAAEDIGDGDDNARRRHREKLKDMLQKIEEQLKPLTQQLARVKDLAVPEFGSLQAWEARAHAAGHPMNGDSGAIDSSRSSQGQGYGGTPMPFLGETRVEVALSGVEAKEDNDGDAGSTAMKQLPPWLIKQGMKLTAEQRGEIRSDLKSASTSAAVDEKKPKDEKDEDANLKDEYYKAYYDALYKRQQLMQEQSETSIDGRGDMNSEPSSERQVGMKSKREEDHNDDDDDDVEWEDASNSGGTNGTAKVADLNLEADATAEDDDDDDGIDWEEG